MIREMVLQDVAAVLAIEQSVQAWPWTEGNFTDTLSHGYGCFVYQQGDDVVAYAVLMQGVDEVELLNIGVAANKQRQGIGRAMLVDILQRAQQSRVFLEVRVSNVSAIALYQNQGFIVVGRRKNYYQTPQGREDALIMVYGDKHESE